MDEITVIYLATTCAIILFLLVGIPKYGPFGFVIAILSIIAILVIFLINYADYLIFPAITQALGINVILAKDYNVPKKQSSVVKYVGGLYYATGYLTANIYGYVFAAENISEGEEAEMRVAPDKWESALMNINFPFKYNVLSTAKDLQKYREELEGQRGFLEFQLARESNSSNPNTMTMDALRRRISILQARIDRISAGERPLKSIMYMETTAVGVSENEAIDTLAGQISQLQTLFSSFDISMSRVVGRELHYLHKFNYRVFDFGEIAAIFQEQK
jgi:hypothetical protein